MKPLTKKKSLFHSLMLLVTACLAMLLVACDLETSLPVEFDKGSVTIRLIDNVTKSDVVTLQESGTATAMATVKDSQGDAIPGVPVEFAASIGGFSPESATALTDAAGVAVVIYNAAAPSTGGFGGSATPALGAGMMKAGAQLTDRIIVSEDLNFQILASDAESTLADNDSFAFFLPAVKSDGFTNNAANPEAFFPSVLDQTVSVQVNMGTQANSTVPDGTKAFFKTEFGSIDTDCSSSAGRCAIDWTATVPIAPDGRSTILAYVEGVESFVDVNGSGNFDDGDTFVDSPGEAFLDQNENGSYDVGEWFKDKNSNGQRDAADGLFSGPSCSHSTLCAVSERVDIFGNVFVNMSNSDAQVMNLVRTDTGVGISRITEGVPISFDLADSNGNPLPVSTQVSISTTNGSLDLSLASTSIPASEQATNYAFTLAVDMIAGPGELTLQTTTFISGRQTTITIPVDD